MTQSRQLTLGILGDGQLGRMLALAAFRLGIKVCVFGPDEDAPAKQVTNMYHDAAFDDAHALKDFAQKCDVIGFEWENIPISTLEMIEQFGAVVRPSKKALAITQDRLVEKEFVRDLGFKTASFHRVDTIDELERAVLALSMPCVLKTRKEGYDGKGQFWIKTPQGVALGFDALGSHACILEAKVDFVRELSIIGVRGHTGEVRIYPLTQNQHRDGVLHTSIAPAKVSQEMEEKARLLMTQCLRALDYVGILAIELFETRDGALLVNEMAPRVHNSGHWTMDAGLCDQFENHVRALAGLPLGETKPLFEIEMTNLLGHEADHLGQWLDTPYVKIHDYGKTHARDGRKMAHLNKIVRTLAL